MCGVLGIYEPSCCIKILDPAPEGPGNPSKPSSPFCPCIENIVIDVPPGSVEIFEDPSVTLA